MSEGGLLAWKIQKVKQPANGVQSTCNLSDLNHPLPDPPQDQMWIKDGREWKLVPVVEAIPTAVEGGKMIEMVSATASVGDSGTVEAVAVSTAVPITCDVAEDGMMYHEVQPTYTFQGVCLRYKVTATELRRANKMMGTNLQLAPKKLLIPINTNNSPLENNASRGATKEELIAKLAWEVLNRCDGRSNNDSSQQNRTSTLAYSEARAYLELNDWDLESAVENAVEDLGWSSQDA